MAVTWGWKNRCGILTYIDELDNKKKYKVSLYEGGNCLGVIINEWYDKEEKKRVYQFLDFWADLDSLKISLGLKKNYNNEFKNRYKDTIEKVRLNTYYKDNLKIADLFAKVGIKVELYYSKY